MGFSQFICVCWRCADHTGYYGSCVIRLRRMNHLTADCSGVNNVFAFLLHPRAVILQSEVSGISTIHTRDEDGNRSCKKGIVLLYNTATFKVWWRCETCPHAPFHNATPKCPTSIELGERGFWSGVHSVLYMDGMNTQSKFYLLLLFAGVVYCVRRTWITNRSQGI